MQCAEKQPPRSEGAANHSHVACHTCHISFWKKLLLSAVADVVKSLAVRYAQGLKVGGNNRRG
jgi:hypothetical protein